MVEEIEENVLWDLLAIHQHGIQNWIKNTINNALTKKVTILKETCFVKL